MQRVDLYRALLGQFHWDSDFSRPSTSSKKEKSTKIETFQTRLNHHHGQRKFLAFSGGFKLPNQMPGFRFYTQMVLANKPFTPTDLSTLKIRDLLAKLNNFTICLNGGRFECVRKGMYTCGILLF